VAGETTPSFAQPQGGAGGFGGGRPDVRGVGETSGPYPKGDIEKPEGGTYKPRKPKRRIENPKGKLSEEGRDGVKPGKK